MEEIQKIFDYQGTEVRTVIKEGEPWFVAKDVCEVLGLLNPTMSVNQLDDDERAKLNLGRQGEANIISEPGLYSLIGSSKKPEAKKFKRWINHEVIPAIRKHGSYTIENAAIPVDTSLHIAESMIRTLRLSESGGLMIYSNICKEYGVSEKIIPSYADENITKSLSELLKQFNVDISAIKANQILIDKGILEPKTRPSKSGIKTFLSLTDSGLKYGKNLISPYNVRETQPHYYEKTFDKLIATMTEEVVLN